MYIYGQSTFSYHFNVGFLLLVHIHIEQNAQNNLTFFSREPNIRIIMMADTVIYWC